MSAREPLKVRMPRLKILLTVAVPTLAYQKQLASGIVEKTLTTKDDMRNFINTMYGGITPDGQAGFSLDKGLYFDRVAKIGKSPLLSDEVKQITWGRKRLRIIRI